MKFSIRETENGMFLTEEINDKEDLYNAVCEMINTYMELE